jgi:hypothetical protein
MAIVPFRRAQLQPCVELPEPHFEEVPARFSKQACYATYFRDDELTYVGFEGLTFKLGCNVGADKLAHVHTFPVSNLYAMTADGGSGVLVLISFPKAAITRDAKRGLENLLAPIMTNIDLNTTVQTVVDRLAPITVFRKDLILNEFRNDYDHPGALAYQNPTYAAGPFPRNYTQEAYIPGRVCDEELAHILNCELPPVVDHRAAPLIRKILLEGADKLWLPKVGSYQQQVQKVENIIEKKTGAKITKEDRREMLQLLKKRDRKECRTCKTNFLPVCDDQVDCDFLCAFAAVCSCGLRSRPERDGRRPSLFALQNGMFPVRCPCGELAFTMSQPATLYIGSLPCLV